MPWKWSDYSVLEFRSSPTSDPTADGHKVARLFVVSVELKRPNEAELQKYAGGFWSRATKLRGAIEIESAPISKIPLPTTASYQDLGAVAQLEDVLYGVGDGPGERHPFVFLYAAYANGNDPDAGPLPRAGKHLHTEDGTNNYFSNTIPLPVRIAFAGTLDPQKGRNQFSKLTFTVQTANYLNA